MHCKLRKKVSRVSVDILQLFAIVEKILRKLNTELFRSLISLN